MKNAVTIRPSDFQKDLWYKVHLPNPMQCYNQYIKGRGMYVGYDAYFPEMKALRKFNLLLPLRKFESELGKIRPNLRDGRPVTFEIMFIKKNLLIRNWEVLE